MNGWIKLHRKIWDSPNFKHRKNIPNLVTIWIWLLTHANEKGEVTFGRYQIAEDTGIHPSSVKRVLEYFRDQMRSEVTYEPTKLFTKIYILNWSKYQDKPINNRPITDQQPTTNKNKEIRIKKEYIEIYNLFISSFKRNPNNYKLTPARIAKINARLKDAGKEMLEMAIVRTSQNSFYMGDNPRNWKADLDFIIRSYEQVEKLAQLSSDRNISIKESNEEWIPV